MIKRTLPLLLLFMLILSSSQAQQWNWANVAGGGSSLVRNILLAKSTSGDFYITGEFQQTQTFGTFTLTPIGNQDVFVAKYDQTGSCLWAIQGGGVFSDNEGLGIATDNSGNVYVGGNFSNQIVFGGYTLNVGTSISSSFIAKFDQSGNCQFLTPISSKGGTVLKNLEKDSQGNFVITGYVNDSTYFGNIGITTVPNAGIDIYLAKFNSSGNFIWVKTAGGNNQDIGYALSSDVFGNIYLGGVFKQTATFGTNALTSYGDFDIFIAKYDNNGNNLWVDKAGGTSADQLYGISNDAQGNTYATGFYYPTPVGMGTTPAHFGNFLLTDNGAGNMFITKLDSAGNFVWAMQGGGNQHDEGYGISTDNNGNSYVTGIFNGSANFGGIPLVSSGTGDAFLVKYNTFGTPLFAQKIGGASADFGKSVISYSNGECIVAGNFSGSITINTSPTTTLASPNSVCRVFIVKYSGGSVGIQDPEFTDESLSLYPNPSNDVLTVSLLAKDNSRIEFLILDNLGRVVQHFTNNPAIGLNDFQFNTSSLSAGNYVLKATLVNGVVNKKFAVIR